MQGDLRLLLHLFRLVTLPHWAEHRLRTALTIVGVSLGVTTVVGVADVNRSVLVSFEDAVRAVAGSSQLEVSSPVGRVDERAIEVAASVRGVRAAEGRVEAFVPLAERAGDQIYLLGLDFLGSPLWRDQLPRDAVDVPDVLAFLAQPDSVMVTRTFADGERLAFGDEVRVVAPGGVAALRIRGLLEGGPAARLFGGMVAVMDLPAAQRLLGRDGLVDGIAVEVQPGAVADVQSRLRGVLGSAVDVEPPEVRGRHCERLLSSLRCMLTTASFLAVIVGALIVFQTVAVSVQERRREFGVLNTVGVNARVLVRLCLGETFVLAIVGVAFGDVVGRTLGALASGIVGVAASDIWVPIDVGRTIHSTTGTIVGAGVGVFVAVLAAYLAVRTTLRSPLARAVQPPGVEDVRARAAWTASIGVALCSATWLIAFAPDEMTVRGAVTLIVITQAAAYGGAAIVGPAFVRASGRILQCVLAWVASLPFRLALENLPRSPQRAGATVATIAAAVGMAVTLAGLVGSFQAAWTSWLEHQFSADLFVGSGGRFRLGAGPAMDASLRADIAEVEGVATVEPFRVLPIRLGERPVFLQGISVRERLQHGGLQMVEGSLSAAASRLRAGEAVLVSDNLASRLGLHAGDAVDVPTPFGPRSFAIAGTFVDFVGSLDLGSIAVDHDQLRLVWGDRSANLFRVWIRPGASLLDVRRGILARIGEGGYYVATSSDFLRQVRSVLDRFFIATWGLQVIAALVAVIGVVNAQLATVLDRSIEIGMMRTIGVRRSDVTRAVVLECAMLGALGSVAGLVLGAMLGAQFVGISLRFVTGWRIPFFAPWTAGSAAILTAAVVSAVAGYVPAARVAMLPSPRSRD